MQSQQTESQKGEIAFRRKLIQQHIEDAPVFADEYDRETIEAILRQRMARTVEQISALGARGIPVCPYLELGAERGQRALAMENDLGARGAAADLSFDMLKSCAYYQKAFDKRRIPVRICCDANHLPFASGSIPFVFCYQTLHHFPDPAPVVREVHRVLSPGGYFFFDEEPYRRRLHLDLYEGKKVYSQESLRAGRARKVLDFFFARKRCNETEFGIIENEEISLRAWKEALAVFGENEVVLRSAKNRICSELFHPRSAVKHVLASWLGGTIGGLSRKAGATSGGRGEILDAAICPSCLADSAQVRITPMNSMFACPRCQRTFPIRDGVIFLLTHEKLEQLYPEVFRELPVAGPMEPAGS
jgi:SAM-dependent methyltransferase